jgi:hypothetical protein
VAFSKLVPQKKDVLSGSGVGSDAGAGGSSTHEVNEKHDVPSGHCPIPSGQGSEHVASASSFVVPQ